ncbi:hypothetical protein B0H10DRAFT_1951269 [Mycena sp. CBHHK59/15]|nr:hypothetical protein B0H10DRAFT_1951269 [Mycena sp. CBHHK59/15]
MYEGESTIVGPGGAAQSPDPAARTDEETGAGYLKQVPKVSGNENGLDEELRNPMFHVYCCSSISSSESNVALHRAQATLKTQDMLQAPSSLLSLGCFCLKFHSPYSNGAVAKKTSLPPEYMTSGNTFRAIESSGLRIPPVVRLTPQPHSASSSPLTAPVPVPTRLATRSATCDGMQMRS